MNSKKYLFVLLLVLMAATRLPGLKSFVAVDEPAWLTRGGNFYYALAQREFENTIYEYHPSVLTMWYVASATFAYFPEYRALDQGYFEVDKNAFDPFLIEHGKSPLELLYISRLFQITVIIVTALMIFYLLSLLIGGEKAFLFTAFVSSAPFFLGNSRVLNHEGMVAFFVLASVFGLMAYLQFGGKWIYLLISAAAAALAQLTKSSAMAMVPVIALILAVSVFASMKERGLVRALLDHLKIFGLWFVLLVIVYVVVWPGMWVAPGKMLYEVYGNAFSYAFQGARLEVTQELEPSQFGLDAAGGAALTLVKGMVWRFTPLTWLGLILAVIFLFQRWEGDRIYRKIVAYLFTTAVMFIVLFSLAQGRNSPHYLLTSHVSLDGIAALGWGMSLGWLGKKWETAGRPVVRAGGVLLLVLLQFASALPFYPYYYNYYSPFPGREHLSDYGEGFERAAAYLAQKPDAESLKALSFRGRGPFSFFFPGETIILNPLFMEEPGMGSMVDRLARADYLVFNDAMPRRTARTAQFAAALGGMEPEHSIHVKGAYTIYIYRVADLPPSFYEAIQK